MTVLPAHHVSVSIERPLDDVIAFLSNLENLPKWASGLGDRFDVQPDGALRITMPEGDMTLTFVGPMAYGIFDHHVTTTDGKVFVNPMRAMTNGTGTEVVFTVYRQPDATDAHFTRDCDWVAKDLTTLKTLLEQSSPTNVRT